MQRITTFYYSNRKQARVHAEVQFDNCLVAVIFRLLSQIGAAAVQMGDKLCLLKQLGLESESADFTHSESATAAVAVCCLRSN